MALVNIVCWHCTIGNPVPMWQCLAMALVYLGNTKMPLPHLATFRDDTGTCIFVDAIPLEKSCVTSSHSSGTSLSGMGTVEDDFSIQENESHSISGIIVHFNIGHSTRWDYILCAPQCSIVIVVFITLSLTIISIMLTDTVTVFQAIVPHYL